MELNREVRKDISRVERKIYKRASGSSIRLNQKMRMEVDASDYTTEKVLFMECKEGQWKSVAFLSKSLNETEKLQNS